MAEKAFISWNDRLSTGVSLIDSQHKQLLLMTNNLYLACRYNNEAARKQFKQTVHDAVAYVKYHFSTEEQIMEKAAYASMGAHKKQHADFVQEVLDNVRAFENGKPFVPVQFAYFLRDWILSHIAITDSRLGGFLTGLAAKGPGKSMILAVDDMKTQLAAFKAMLTGYDVFTCVSPLQALEIADHMDVDLVLLDLAMEEMSGYEFLQHIKKDRRLSGIPVIVVSGNKTEQHITASIKLGAAGFIAKPVDPILLRQEIRRLLDARSGPV